MNAIVNCAAYKNGRKESDIKLNEVKGKLAEPNTFVWIGMYAPSADLLSVVQKEFNLHELAIEDAANAHQRPKIELYGNIIFMALRTAQINKETLLTELGETHFFIGVNFILTIRHGSSIPYTEVRKRCESMPDLLLKGPGFAAYAVMDSIVDQYFPVIEQMEEELIKVEEKIFDEKPSRETTEQIYNLKRELIKIKQCIAPLPDICNKLMRFDNVLVPDDIRPYFRDVLDHSQRINEMMDHSRELVTAALEANFSLTSIAQSEVSKKFAGWAAIIGVPTMVAGIYGMNFKSMPELSWPYAYPLVLSLTFLLCFLLYIFFKRSGWL
jgi:magnesium transporter